MKYALLIGVAVIIGSCRNPAQADLSGSLDTNQLSPDPVSVVFNYQPDQPILPIDFGSHSGKTVIISKATGRQAFLVKTNTSTQPIPGITAGTGWSRSLTEEAPGYPLRREHEAALLFNANPPPIPQETRARSLAGTITYGNPPPLAMGRVSVKSFCDMAKPLY